MWRQISNYVSENGHIFTMYYEKDISKGLHLLNVHIKKCGNINNNFYLAPKYYGAKWHPFLILCLIKLIFLKHNLFSRLCTEFFFELFLLPSIPSCQQSYEDGSWQQKCCLLAAYPYLVKVCTSISSWSILVTVLNHRQF